MTTEVDSFQIFRNSVYIAIIILFWTVLSWFAWEPIIATGVRYTGLIIALFYAVVQGFNLEQSRPHPHNSKTLLRENTRVLSVAGPWFLAAIVIYVISDVWSLLYVISDEWSLLALPGAFISPADSFAFILVATGVVTTVLYLVTVGRTRIRIQT